MKQATQLALYGTIAMAFVQIVNFIFGYNGEISFYLRIIDLFGMITLVNFFYRLNQKQQEKIEKNSDGFKEWKYFKTFNNPNCNIYNNFCVRTFLYKTIHWFLGCNICFNDFWSNVFTFRNIFIDWKHFSK